MGFSPGFVTSELKWIRADIQAFLKNCRLIFPNVEPDKPFLNQCIETAEQNGWPMEGPKSLRPFIPGGVGMATTAYAHLPDRETRIYIALYTAFLIYTDDVFEADVSLVVAFNDHFVRGIPQDDPVLDSFATFLRSTSVHFKPLVANLIIASTLNLISALLLEYETRGMKISSDAESYPTFTRVLCGASEAYGLFAFPASMPICAYIQALPEMMKFINNGNDILSFYKEELAGETVNTVSLLAACRGVRKRNVMRNLIFVAVRAHKRVQAILEDETEAQNAYSSFSQGYIGFHAALRRYRLEDLKLKEECQQNSLKHSWMFKLCSPVHILVFLVGSFTLLLTFMDPAGGVLGY